MIVPVFTSFVEDFVIGCNRMNHQTSLLKVLNSQFASCKEPRNLGFLADLAILVFVGSEYKNCASVMPLLKDVPDLSRKKNLRLHRLMLALLPPLDFL